MSAAMTKASEALKSIAEKLDTIFLRLTGQQMSFSLIVWNRTGDERANYISNCPRPEVVKAMKELLARWEAGMPDVPGHKIN